jgi:signal transduction histidine kinase
MGVIFFVRFVEKKKLNARLNETLANLKATQTQLVHAEKMASLGELTAGIAHEIQNPLNFVNNFSEVTKEMLDELNENLAKGDTEEVQALSADINQNLVKIIFHGKRADSIVKGMLQHSRNSSGKKEPVNLNAMADEYLRLSFHGLRARDKSFNADYRLEPADNLPQISVVPQEIGRVLLNLVNNAFYAVRERAMVEKADYHPKVTVTTRIIAQSVEIRVTDNGKGIPPDVLDKIFKPFFTTKPTGEGTGLGLSLSHDIVTKGHGGELKVETTENEGTSFIIILPYKFS